MPTDMNVWRQQIKDAVRDIADEDIQRKAWFPGSKYMSSPTEAYCQFFDDSAIEKYLAMDDNGLDDRGRQLGQNLIDVMNKISGKVFPEKGKYIKLEDLINDPEWEKCREAAKQFLAVL